jgi:hypothetical protein
MEDPALALILDECLALLDAGEDVDVIIGRFPDFSDALEPLLRVAANLTDAAETAVDVPMAALKDIGEFIQDQVQELTD